jgi:acyl-CoA thioesterase I
MTSLLGYPRCSKNGDGKTKGNPRLAIFRDRSAILYAKGHMKMPEIKLTQSVCFIIGVMTLIFLSCSCSRTKKESVLKTEHQSVGAPMDQAGDHRPLIVAFGNSLTAGAGVDPNQNYPSKLQAKLDAYGYQYKVVNAGISGETTSQGLARVPNYIALRPAIVIVELGANDGLRGLPVETTRRNLDAIVGQFKSSGAKVILAGMKVPPNYGPLYANSFRGIFPSVAKEHDAVLIPFFLEGVGGHPNLNQDDGIHPTAEGYTLIVENVWDVLEPLL